MLIERVRLRNYKSIASCDVGLASLALIVGRNGSGKSNFLDGLSFVADVLRTSLDEALRVRGGLLDVARRVGTAPLDFGVSLDLRAGAWGGRYDLDIELDAQGGARIAREVLSSEVPGAVGYTAGAGLHFRVERGVVVACSADSPPAADAGTSFLRALSGTVGFRDVFAGLVSMAFYRVDPRAMREFQPHGSADVLLSDGRNCAGVVKRLQDRRPSVWATLLHYFRRVVPEVWEVRHVTVGGRETLLFATLSDSPDGEVFFASSMSDGTLRALAILVALFQHEGDPSGALVGIEEPELALHPQAASLLLSAMRAASQHTQVLATTHSPDLLDDDDLTADQLLAVEKVRGVTRIGTLDARGRGALADRLYTAGELLKQDVLLPESGPDLFHE